jgi:hypothetical protein
MAGQRPRRDPQPDTDDADVDTMSLRVRLRIDIRSVSGMTTYTVPEIAALLGISGAITYAMTAAEVVLWVAVQPRCAGLEHGPSPAVGEQNALRFIHVTPNVARHSIF